MDSGYRKTIHKLLKADKIKNLNSPYNKNKILDCLYDTVIINNSMNQNNPPKFINSRVSNPNVFPNAKNNDKVIVVVLESPHKEEFKNPMLPLKKDNFFRENFLKQFISLQHNNTVYHIYIMNAIQFQCSLGSYTECYRDYVFLYLWYYFKKDFNARLTNICQKYDVQYIFNLCTKGDHKYNKYLYNENVLFKISADISTKLEKNMI